MAFTKVDLGVDKPRNYLSKNEGKSQINRIIGEHNDTGTSQQINPFAPII